MWDVHDFEEVEEMYLGVLAPTRGRSLRCPTPTSSPLTTIGGRVHYLDVLATKDAIMGLWRDLGDTSENRCLINLNVPR